MAEHVAVVVDVTPTGKHDKGGAPVDVVRLEYDGRQYWGTVHPGTYAVGQRVPFDPPASGAE